MISRDSLKGITSVIAVGLAIFQIYFTAGFGIIDSQLLRTIHLGIVLALVFLYFPPKKLQEGEREHPGWLALDLVLICGAFATAYFLASDIDYYMERIRYVDPVSDAETVCATAAVLLVLEATRRVAGLPLVIVASAFLAYGLGGQYLPGILRHDGVTYKMLCEQLYLVTEGLYGIPLAVSSTMIFAFVMFGCFLQRAGLGQVFLDLACVLTRRSKGGPAKVSIFASALFGSISGSAVANVYSTGTFTIPLMKRVGYHGNDLERIEKLNALSRRICAEVPDPETAQRWLKETTAAVRSYAVWTYYLGNFMAAAGFCCVFGGTVRDWLWAGLSGLIIGFVTRCMDRLEVNPFFSTIAASFLMALPAYLAAGLGWLDCVAVVIIGALMLLVPGLLITNSMRDIIYGDTSSGVSRIVQVLLSAFAIALGTAAAWHVTTPIYGHAEAAAALTYPLWAQGIATFFACMGFVILFNVHDWGSVLCALGSALTWIVYLLCSRAGFSIYSANFFSEVVAAVYSEGMGRWRKCPVTSYLVISSIPLLPGAGIYYTMSIGLSGSVQAALQKGLETAGIAGSLAVGILLVSTVFRAVNARRHPAAHL
mgnify:CR=1 FL=1